MPGCGALDRRGQILALGFVLRVLNLLWPEVLPATTTTTSTNKSVAGCFLFLVFAAFSHLPPSGSGCKGMEMVGAQGRSSGCSGSVAVLVRVRGAERLLVSSASSFHPLLSGRGGERIEEGMLRRAASSLFIKRGLLPLASPPTARVHLAGHGGEEVVLSRQLAAGLVGVFRELLKLCSLERNPWWQSSPPCSLAGRAALSQPPVWRPLLNLAAGARPLHGPKWFVPGAVVLACGFGSSSEKASHRAFGRALWISASAASMVLQLMPQGRRRFAAEEDTKHLIAFLSLC